MNKGSHFIGQPAYGQLINLLDRTGILEISRSNGGERSRTLTCGIIC